MSALAFRIVQSHTPQNTQQPKTVEERLRDHIEDQEHELRRLRQAALRDPLTGGANMRCLAIALDWLENEDPVSVLSINIDGFHKVNDALGRTCGDALLTAVQTALERALRWDDVVAREGSDRFVALLPLAIQEDAVAVAERLRESVEKMCFEVEQGRFQLTVRIGCASRNGREELNAILGRADSACRQARRGGGNVVTKS